MAPARKKLYKPPAVLLLLQTHFYCNTFSGMGMGMGINVAAQ